jgi:hypothetical protein
MRLAQAAPPLVLRAACRLAAARPAAEVLVTNIPGPPDPLYLMGARLREVYPVAPLFATTSTSVAALSYSGGLYLGVGTDPELVPSLDPLLAGIADDVAALWASSR